ncbi:3'(2'),5'-bisphosphate nucleotidase CysQ [Brucella gallinifaecis]|uniref:3'(2'),5'-bisphosphate nucleotidase CysQ n=1 Tax=Brucella gallinifaecis TaxID=215590 RepID=A0A502BNX5_9HYPH|nr:3'(2'),5'-bisphosphate nucleotidase CysQ [Brucella gallinifaecis]TPF75517.1 3'(2'),5'-bisphosphate nucleotidase CysQ [Brucella gallinifaecis]
MITATYPIADPSGKALLATLEDTVLEAGRVIMRYYVDGCAVYSKEDHSPVTQADQAAEAIILAALAAIAPDIPVVAEEEAAAGRLPTRLGRHFFLVDPLDGTREFLLRNGDFTVNIALIEDGIPVLGLVYAPARNLLYVGDREAAQEVATSADHQITSRRPITARIAPPEKVVVCSRSHLTPETEKFLKRNHSGKCVSVGSSLKFCMIARGEADLYPRFGPTMEWDTAAGDAVLRAAGGMTTTLDAKPIIYGARFDSTVKGFSNPEFVAFGAGEVPVFA